MRLEPDSFGVVGDLLLVFPLLAIPKTAVDEGLRDLFGEGIGHIDDACVASGYCRAGSTAGYL